VARAWSGYVDSLVGFAISNASVSTVGEMHEQLLGHYPDFLAFAVCLVYSCLLGIGVKGSAIFNSLFTIINLGVMMLVVGGGFYYADIKNWNTAEGFVPFGFSGVIAGAATCVYAVVGFDSIGKYACYVSSNLCVQQVRNTREYSLCSNLPYLSEMTQFS
jgi:cationic amino acid transporter 4